MAEEKATLDDLAARIAKARGTSGDGEGPRAGPVVSGAGLAWRMVIDLVTGVLLGAAIGWGLDSVLGTLPLFFLIVGMMGLAAGVKTMIRSAAEYNGKAAGTDAPGRGREG